MAVWLVRVLLGGFVVVLWVGVCVQSWVGVSDLPFDVLCLLFFSSRRWCRILRLSVSLLAWLGVELGPGTTA